jgi:hypothetical protein
MEINNTERRKNKKDERICTDRKENEIFLIYKEIQMGEVAKSYMRKGFLIYEEMQKYLTNYEEAVSHKCLCNRSLLNFLMYKENSIFSVWQCYLSRRGGGGWAGGR